MGRFWPAGGSLGIPALKYIFEAAFCDFNICIIATTLHYYNVLFLVCNIHIFLVIIIKVERINEATV